MTRRRKCCLLLAAVVLIAAALLHAPILRGLARPLIVDQPADDFDYVCIVAWGRQADADRCYDMAGDACRERPSRRVLLIAQSPSRIEQIGAMPSFHAVSLRELSARGVSSDAVSQIRGGRCNDWANARSLAAWLREHPGKSVLLLCSQFRSAQVRGALDSVLDPADAMRVFVRGLPSQKYDDTNWWKLRYGYQAFGAHWLLRFQGWLGGGDLALPPERNADQYRREFLQTLPERTP